MGRKTKITLLTITIVLLGFLRGYLFANINWIFLTLANGRMNAARPEFYFLLDWSLTEIAILKWVLTFVFTAAFFGFTYWIVKVMFNKQQYNKIVLLVYLGLIGIAAILYLIGNAFGFYDTIYGPIRTIMGISQSFMPLMILVILFKFFPETK